MQIQNQMVDYKSYKEVLLNYFLSLTANNDIFTAKKRVFSLKILFLCFNLNRIFFKIY